MIIHHKLSMRTLICGKYKFISEFINNHPDYMEKEKKSFKLWKKESSKLWRIVFFSFFILSIVIALYNLKGFWECIYTFIAYFLHFFLWSYLLKDSIKFCVSGKGCRREISYEQNCIIALLSKERNLKHKELGAIIGVAQNTVCNWENGKREPDHESLKELAVFFDCSYVFVWCHYIMFML